MTFMLSFKELGHYGSYNGVQKQDTTYAYAKATDNVKLGGKESTYSKQSHVRRQDIYCTYSIYSAYKDKLQNCSCNQ